MVFHRDPAGQTQECSGYCSSLMCLSHEGQSKYNIKIISYDTL